MFNIIIGEKLNSSVKKTFDALNERNDDYLIRLIRYQEKCGANHLDLNTAMCENEMEKMLYLTELTLNNSSCSVIIDTVDTNVIKEAAAYINKKSAGYFIINSITVKQRIDELLPVINKYRCGVICLPILQYGNVITADERLENAETLITRLTSEGVAKNNIYIDAVVDSLAMEEGSSLITFSAIKKIKLKYPDVNVICGISNSSYGLPERKNINAAFLTIAISCGLNGAIFDVTSEDMRSAMHASNALCGNDEYCMEYINYIRNNKKELTLTV